MCSHSSFLTNQVKNLSEYGLVVADMIAITDKGADIMTKFGRNRGDISYSMLDEDSGDDDDEESDDDDADRKLAKKIAKEEAAAPSGGRKSSRLAANAASAADVEGIAERERKQIELMARRNEERLRELARSSRKKGGDEKSKKA